MPHLVLGKQGNKNNLNIYNNSPEWGSNPQLQCLQSDAALRYDSLQYKYFISSALNSAHSSEREPENPVLRKLILIKTLSYPTL